MSRYIDADAVMKRVEDSNKSAGLHLEDLRKIRRWIKTAPSIDIESKRGEWITIDTEVISVPVYWNEEQRQSDERGAGILEKCECSVCGWRKNFLGYKKLGVNKSYNFCPNCGADMRERKDERDYL